MTDDHVTCRARLAQVSLNSPCVLPFSSAGVGRETGPGGVNCHALQYYYYCSTVLFFVPPTRVPLLP